MSLRAQAARGVKWQAVEIAGRQLIGLAVFTTLARLLDASAFGMVALVGAYLTLIGVFGEQGIGQALIQRKDLEPEHLESAFWFNVGCAAILCLITIVIAEPASRALGEARLVPLLRWASLSLVISAAGSVHHVRLVRELDFRRPALCALVANATGGAIGVGMAIGGCGVWALIGQQLSAATTATVFLWVASGWRPRCRFSLHHLRQLFAVSWALFAAGLLWFVSSRADQFFIGRVLGTAPLGIYVVGGKVADLVRITIYQPIGAVALPALAKVQDDYERLRNVVYRGMALNATAAAPALLGLVAITPDAVPLLFGEKWLPAVPILQLLAIYTLVHGLQVFFHPLLIATGGPGGYLVLNVLHALGVITACAVGVRLGLAQMILCLIASSVAVGILAFWFLMRRVGLKVIPFWKPCVWPIVAASVMLLGIWHLRTWTHTPPLVTVLWEIAVGAVLYVGVMLLLSRESISLVMDFMARAMWQNGQASPQATDPLPSAG